MKKMNLILACTIFTGALVACNSGSDSNSTTSTTTTDSNSASTTNTTGNTATTDNTSTTATTATPKAPLSAQDSMFVMKAAMGGMMEVEAGNLAQQNAANDRVKSFASMMVADHTKANQELMSLASGRVSLPTELPADKKKHMEDMSKMTGKAFDKHYMDMMVSDHKKTIADFEKQANSGADTDLKAWAQKTLPTLKMHADSAMAINKMKM